jgi:predicted esterase
MDSETFWELPLVRALRALCLGGHFLVSPLVLVMCVLLFLVAETPEARLVASGIFFLWLGSLALWLLFLSRSGRTLLVVGFPVLTGLVCLAVAFGMRPGGAPAGSNFTEHYSGEARFRPAALPNLVPEIDQLKLGTFVMEKLDGPLAASGTARLRDLVLKVYREANGDPAFRETGSALGYVYEDLFLGERELLHFYQYVPRQLKRERYPVLIFLHGAFGNFKGYSWVLKRFSDQTGIAVIAPTFGGGDWRNDRKGLVMKEVLAYCATQPELDTGRMYLSGLSNGGMGVSRQLARGGTKWAGVVYFSPVIEAQVIQKPEFIQAAKGLPILIIHGEEDDRIPFAAIKELAGVLRANGAVVTERYYPAEDHFLVFSQPEAVVGDVVGWLP